MSYSIYTKPTSNEPFIFFQVVVPPPPPFFLFFGFFFHSAIPIGIVLVNKKHKIQKMNEFINFKSCKKYFIYYKKIVQYN
jgi:hypothetical protein